MTGQEGPPDPRPDELPEDEGPVGIFPSWRWLYAAVLAWAALLVLILWIFTVTLDRGGS